MATTSVYLLKILENPTIEISQDELLTLLGEIEAELHQSKVYLRAMAVLRKLLGSSADVVQAQSLFKAVSREAIGLAFRQFMQQYQKVEENTQQPDTNSEIPTAEETDSTDLSQCITSVKFHKKNTDETTNKVDLPSKPQEVTNTVNHSVKTEEDKSKTKKPVKWFSLNRKRRQAELAKQMADQQRIESLHQIGQKLRQARESRGFSLNQLHVYTHVQLRYMEAVENGDWELLPEDIFVRGYIRVMGNALGLDGIALAACLPASEPMKAVLPTWYQPQRSFGSGFAIHPLYVYAGYTTLIAGAVGGLSILSQQTHADRLIHKDAAIPSSLSLTNSPQDTKPASKPGIKSSNGRVTVGADISPPEAL